MRRAKFGIILTVFMTVILSSGLLYGGDEKKGGPQATSTTDSNICDSLQKEQEVSNRGLLDRARKVQYRVVNSISHLLNEQLNGIHFKESGVKNAVACGRGNIYITSAVLSMCDSSGYFEDCLSFVIGHELGHITTHFFWERALVSPASGPSKKELESEERQADTLGVFYMTLAGYNIDNIVKNSKFLEEIDENNYKMRIQIAEETVEGIKQVAYMYQGGVYMYFLGMRDYAKELFKWVINNTEYKFPEAYEWLGIISFSEGINRLERNDLMGCKILYPYGKVVENIYEEDTNIVLRGLRGAATQSVDTSADQYFREAERYFNKAREAKGDDPAVLNNLACTYYYLHEKGTASDKINIAMKGLKAKEGDIYTVCSYNKLLFEGKGKKKDTGGDKPIEVCVPDVSIDMGKGDDCPKGFKKRFWIKNEEGDETSTGLKVCADKKRDILAFIIKTSDGNVNVLYEVNMSEKGSESCSDKKKLGFKAVISDIYRVYGNGSSVAFWDNKEKKVKKYVFIQR